MNDAEQVTKDNSFRAPDELLKAQALANLLDYSVKLPIFGLKIGMDSIVGLIPLVGDLLMFLASMRILFLGYRMKLPKPLLSQMMRNCVIDLGLGFIPIIGDIADMFFKANLKNVRIMEIYWLSKNKDIIDAQSRQALSDWEKNLASQESN